ncbi:Cys-tRNA(Pro) deacylase [Marinospirillum sp. MEB164]|uniref:Cys-tRNA(Pro)/Cys-tRNA(Cys) deacylase n=1 Tax=Marinospirillum alkalitolerans TaxID=3123374 RepID=A0ABW8PWM5_9GAMM
MTPAVLDAQRQRIDFHLHEYQHDPQAASYGLEAAEKMGVPAARVFKTLVVQLNSGQLVVALVPVMQQLNLKLLAQAAGAKKASLAPAALVEKTTGYVLGGVSPLGQKKKLPTWVDLSALDDKPIYVSAGRRGLEIQLAVEDLLRLTQGQTAHLTLAS